MHEKNTVEKDWTIKLLKEVPDEEWNIWEM